MQYNECNVMHAIERMQLMQYDKCNVKFAMLSMQGNNE